MLRSYEDLVLRLDGVNDEDDVVKDDDDDDDNEDDGDELLDEELK